MRPRHSALLAFLALAATTALGGNESATGFSKSGPVLETPDIEAMVKIPAGSFNFVRDRKTGKTIIISDNARYFITEFRLVDTWHKNKEIRTGEELLALSSRIDPAMMPYDQMAVLEMNPTGTRQLTAFVDPGCPHSAQFLKALQADKSIHARLLVVPVLGENSEAMARRLDCAMQKGQAPLALQALLTHKFDSLPADDSCASYDKTRNNLLTARIIGVEGVPYLISHDGRMVRGVPPSLVAFIENKPESEAEAQP